MRHLESKQRDRRVTLAAMGLSAVAHVAALAWLALPASSHAPVERQPLTVALVTPEAVQLQEPTAPERPPVENTAPAAEGGGAGLSGAAGSAAPEAAAAPAPTAESFVVAGQDSVASFELGPVGEAEVVVVVAAATPAEAVSPQPAAPTYKPGSAASAKNRGAGKNAGSAGAGASRGVGGISISIGGKGPKRHPPRGLPGRGRW